MTELTADVGALRNDDERCAVRFERLYDFTPDEALVGSDRPGPAGTLARDGRRRSPARAVT